MKKSIVILAIVFALASCRNPTKYRIKSGSGEYVTNSYQEVDGCVTFKNECASGESKSVKICGTYTIIKK
jgi:hypothetical protein